MKFENYTTEEVEQLEQLVRILLEEVCRKEEI